MAETEVGLRVGELAERIGVSPETLRAWERRYGVLQPRRTPGGYRAYGPQDEARARRMVALIGDGWSAARAARTIARETAVTASDVDAATLSGLLEDALMDFDAERAHALLDRLFAAHPRGAVLEEGVLPVLRAIGDGWERGKISVAQEHFATELLVGRLRALTRGWEEGAGPRAVLACPSAERHDTGLLCCGLVLRDHGWRVTYLGADTPATALADAVERTRPDALVIGVLQPEPLAASVEGLAALAATTRVCVGGAGAVPELVRAAGAERLEDGPVAAAATLAAGV
jgi:methanogenic corrinoid protein MtbC1